jgi:hypothetical protein
VKPLSSEPVAAWLRSICRDYVTARPPAAPVPEADDALRLAREQQLTPLLGSALEGTLAGDDAFALALRHDTYRSTARQARLTALLRAVLPGLASRGVPVIVLKGAVLAERYYRRAADRPMRDVDLLVRREHVPTVLSVARDAGLERYADAHSLAFDLRFGGALVLTRDPDDDRRPSLDLHWDLFDDWRPRRHVERWHDDAWARAEPTEIAGHPALALCREDMFLHLAAHLANHHAFGGLLWHCDLALMLGRDAESLDWDRLLADAGALGLRRTLALIFDAVEATLGVTPPPRVRRVLPRHAPRLDAARRLVLPRVRRLEAMAHLGHMVALLLMDRARDCARALAGAVVPSPGWVESRYERRWPGAYARHYANAFGILTRSLAGPP